jgi:hypothetical protein
VDFSEHTPYRPRQQTRNWLRRAVPRIAPRAENQTVLRTSEKKQGDTSGVKPRIEKSPSGWEPLPGEPSQGFPGGSSTTTAFSTL